MKMQFKKFLALAGLSGFAVAQSNVTLQQALSSNSNLSMLATLVNSSSLVGALGMLSNVTILAPNNDAISALTNNTAMAQALQADPNLLNALLSYHIITPGNYSNFSANATFYRTALANMTQYTLVENGQRVEISNTTATSGLLEMSNVTASPIEFNGGSIHVIDKVLTLPTNVSTTAQSLNLTSFYGALNTTMMLTAVNTLPNSTFFAPNNAAFRAIGSGLANLTMEQAQAILGYHVVNGTVGYSTRLMNGTQLMSSTGGMLTITMHNGSYFVNSAKVVLPNVLVANGVLHVIDEVLNPQNTMIANSTATAGAPAYTGVSSVTMDPYTSGQPTATSVVNTASVQSSMSSAASASSSSSSGGAWMPAPTGAMGVALGGLALVMQL